MAPIQLLPKTLSLGVGALVAMVLAGVLGVAATSGPVSPGGGGPGPAALGGAGPGPAALGGAGPGPAALGGATIYGLPVAGPPEVARRFEAPAQAWSAGHRGVDLRSVAGAQVLAPADGVVAFAGSVAGRGVVTVVHPDGRRSSVEPVDPTVVVGNGVTLGQPIGTLQTTGSHCAPAACLHWGVREGDDYVDPLVLLPGAGPVVLLS